MDAKLNSDNQFGFKKGVGCSYAIRTVRGIVDNYVSKGNTANFCTIDISKLFDRVNHFGLLSKLMKRLIPVQLLHLLKNWLLNGYSCVKWADSFSQFLKLDFGVRQGSVMSPLLFAVYVDDFAKSCDCSRGIYVVLYADDILLQNFFTSSHTVLVSPYQTASQYSNGNPHNRGVECMAGRQAEITILSQYLASLHVVKRSSGRCNRLSCDRPRRVITLVAGERPSLLMVGNNNEVYDKKPQRYAEHNVTQR